MILPSSAGKQTFFQYLKLTPADHLMSLNSQLSPQELGIVTIFFFLHRNNTFCRDSSVSSAQNLNSFLFAFSALESNGRPTVVTIIIFFLTTFSWNLYCNILHLYIRISLRVYDLKNDHSDIAIVIVVQICGLLNYHYLCKIQKSCRDSWETSTTMNDDYHFRTVLILVQKTDRSSEKYFLFPKFSEMLQRPAIGLIRRRDASSRDETHTCCEGTGCFDGPSPAASGRPENNFLVTRK